MNLMIWQLATENRFGSSLTNLRILQAAQIRLCYARYADARY